MHRRWRATPTSGVIDLSLTETVETGDVRASLEAIRNKLADELEAGAMCKKCGGVLSSPTAQLSKELKAVIKEIDQLPKKEGSAVDDIAAQRRKRKARSSDRAAVDG